MNNIQPTDEEIKTIQVFPTSVLIAAANNQVDLNVLARAELANRGLDADGAWVGFTRAKEIHG